MQAHISHEDLKWSDGHGHHLGRSAGAMRRWTGAGRVFGAGRLTVKSIFRPLSNLYDLMAAVGIGGGGCGMVAQLTE